MKTHSVNRALIEKIGKAYGSKIPTISYLREESTLLNNKAGYKFSFAFGNETNQPATSKMLKSTEAFYATGIGLYLLFESTTKKGQGILQTYPNEFEVQRIIGAGAAIGGLPDTNSDDLNAIYNGRCSFKVGQTEVFTGLDTRRFFKVPTSQRNAMNGYSEAGYDDGILPLEPHLHIHGSETQELAVEIPSWAGMGIQSNRAGIDVKLVAVLEGVVIPSVNDVDFKAAKGVFASMRNSA